MIDRIAIVPFWMKKLNINSENFADIHHEIENLQSESCVSKQ